MTTIERLPPHSLEAEEAVLGSLLIDPDAIYDVSNFLRPEAFYKAQNRWIYEAILALNNRHEPIDFITLIEELRRQERLEELGGEAYVIGLINAVPTSVNARSYGRLVEAAALRRKMISAAGTIANLAYDEAEDINIVIDRAEQALFSISEERTTRDLVPIKQIAHAYLDRIQALNAQDGDIVGVPTGFVDLDRLLGGLNKSDLIILAGRPGMGKCVTADTRLIDAETGELVAIEKLVARRQANLLTLKANYKLRPTQATDFIDNGIKPVYRVTTALGRTIETTFSHPFLTIVGWQPLHKLSVGNRVAVPRIIPVFGNEDMPSYQVKVLAYLLADGSLTETSPRFTNANPRLREDYTQAALQFPGNKATVRDSNGTRTPTVYITQEPDLVPNGHAQSSQILNTLTHWLQTMGVWGKSASEKDVPSVVYRLPQPKLALFLNRLFAGDGSVYLQNEKQPIISYTTVAKSFAKSVQHLLLRFGILAKLRHRRIRYDDSYREAYQVRVTDAQSIITFVEQIGIFGKEAALEKAYQRCLSTERNTNNDTIPVEIWEDITRIKGSLSWAEVQRRMGLADFHHLHVGKRAPSRKRLKSIGHALNSPELVQLAESDIYWDKIVAIEPLGMQQVYDLTVPETHNFVAEDMIVHNTALQNGFALTAALKHGKRVAIFNLEMSGEQLVQRMVASETKIDSQRLRRGQLMDHEWNIFMEAVGRLSETRIFIDDTPSITTNQLRTKCRRLYAEHGLDLVIIDYLQLMSAERGTNNRVMEISEISRGLKGLARELDIPVLAAAQLSRAVEQRQDKRPLLSDLRDSGCLAGDTLVPLADTGQRIPIRELVGQSGFVVWALNPDTYQLERATVSKAFSTGTKQTYKIETKLGRTIRATANHKFLTIHGWKRLDELAASEHLALPRFVPETHRQLYSVIGTAYSGMTIFKQNMSRERASRVAVATQSETMQQLAESDVYWDQIELIELDAVEEVFDLTVPGPHNFIANDMIVHNSIEQDADIVMFIYRDEYYNPDTTERPNIAELNIAKHRNGPTGTIDLYWHGKLATFRNLQRQEINL